MSEFLLYAVLPALGITVVHVLFMALILWAAHEESGK